MKARIWKPTLALMVAVQIPASAAVWVESVDAGDSLAGSQQTLGAGALTQISGTLPSDSDADIYQITIPNPAVFKAWRNGLVTTDPDLWLFSVSGMGIVHNDVVMAGETSLTGGFVPSAGTYYLAITNDGAVAYGSGGDIWLAAWNYVGARAPDGPGAAQPFIGWTGPSMNNGVMSYTILLQGAEFAAIPEPTVVPLLGLGGFAICRRGRRPI